MIQGPLPIGPGIARRRNGCARSCLVHSRRSSCLAPSQGSAHSGTAPSRRRPRAASRRRPPASKATWSSSPTARARRRRRRRSSARSSSTTRRTSSRRRSSSRRCSTARAATTRRTSSAASSSWARPCTRWGSMPARSRTSTRSSRRATRTPPAAPASSGSRRVRACCPRPRASSRRSAATTRGRSTTRRSSRCTTSSCSCSAATTPTAAAPGISQRRSRCSARCCEGLTDGRKDQGKPAVDAFKDILLIGEERPKQYRTDDIDNYRELAQLQMARVFYSTQQFDTSIKYFEKLDQNSLDWPESLFEASWAYYMKTLNSKALGNIHTLNAPYFENQFFPESVLLKSVIYFKYCLYDQAEESVADFNEKYTPLTKNLTDLVAKYDDNAEFYEYVKKVKGTRAGLDPVTQRLVMSVLNDKTLLKTCAWVDELNHELEMLQKSDKAWQTTRVAAEVLQELTVQQSVAAADAGKVARDRVARLARELGAMSRDGSKIKFEILEAKGNRLTAEAAGTDRKSVT